jgi:hypothetical protein
LSKYLDIKVNAGIGMLFLILVYFVEYVGRGKSLIDVGLAQARTPLCTRSHYFEIEIIDPGSNCYIAIGLARKDYPRCQIPLHLATLNILLASDLIKDRRLQ